ncbi:hypothetical protein LTR37_020280 [Vermiconidia calcicola]|uniref:Uncharacterized protein n=1 Tax=Vermiconidia calcicola TaxID=1690605 RepID=A0ACC3MEU4_9PEZI|nr:hypothetical protein LTR37_020280 [Vermiconidia calcicola]
MFVAIEAFVDAEHDIRQYDGGQLLRRFGDYVAGLETQPVTVTTSSLVEDMLDSYANVTRGLESFSWKQNLEALIEEFISTRECFFYSHNRAPVLEATFRVTHYRADELDIDLHFTWSPPHVEFQDLRNVITEGNEFHLKPNFSSRPSGGSLPVTAEYFIGPGDGWLHWDGEQECFRGVVPRQMASRVGAERFEAYTVPLKLTARITKSFPGEMRFERILRCALPLTVKRRPSNCACDSETAASPTVARPAGSQMNTEQHSMSHTPKRSYRGPRGPEVSDLPNAGLTRPPLMRSPLRRLPSRPRPSPPPPTPRTWTCEEENKENEHLRMDDLHKLMERKAQHSWPQSPLRLNSLTLARLHDAMALSNPPSSLTDVEVHTLHRVRRDSEVSNQENRDPQTPEPSVKAGTVRCQRTRRLNLIIDGRKPTAVNLGSTHINRHGKLASRSDVGGEHESGFYGSPVAKDISPVFSVRGSASKNEVGRNQYSGPILSPSKRSKTPHAPKLDAVPSSAADKMDDLTCYACSAGGRTSRLTTKDGNAVCSGCQEATIHEWVDDTFRHGSEEDKMQLWGSWFAFGSRDNFQKGTMPTPEGSQGRHDSLATSGAATGRQDPDQWQAAVRQNFKEFQTKKEEKMDVTMEDAVDSEEDLPSFQSDL